MNIKTKIKTYSVDEFGIRNYHSGYLLVVTIAVLYSIIALLSVVLLHYELAVENANITSYKDAFWTLQMSASTIGFGDFYPISFAGRLIVALMFYIGVGMVGFIGAQALNKFVGFSDTNVKNRELRRQNDAILAHNKLLELKIEQLHNSVIKLVAQNDAKSNND